MNRNEAIKILDNWSINRFMPLELSNAWLHIRTEIAEVSETTSSTQQLKSEIAIIAKTIHIMAHNNIYDKESMIFVCDKLRQLSME